MPANPYPQIATNLITEESNITSSWGFAETELATQAAPATAFLEIQWDGISAISRVFDSAQVSSLAQSEQLRLYPQLGGLFNLAMRNLLYP
jgi:hypothetical protein